MESGSQVVGADPLLLRSLFYPFFSRPVEVCSTVSIWHIVILLVPVYFIHFLVDSHITLGPLSSTQESDLFLAVLCLENGTGI